MSYNYGFYLKSLITFENASKYFQKNSIGVYRWESLKLFSLVLKVFTGNIINYLHFYYTTTTHYNWNTSKKMYQNQTTLICLYYFKKNCQVTRQPLNNK